MVSGKKFKISLVLFWRRFDLRVMRQPARLCPAGGSAVCTWRCLGETSWWGDCPREADGLLRARGMATGGERGLQLQGTQARPSANHPHPLSLRPRPSSPAWSGERHWAKPPGPPEAVSLQGYLPGAAMPQRGRGSPWVSEVCRETAQWDP